MYRKLLLLLYLLLDVHSMQVKYMYDGVLVQRGQHSAGMQNSSNDHGKLERRIMAEPSWWTEEDKRSEAKASLWASRDDHHRTSNRYRYDTIQGLHRLPEDAQRPIARDIYYIDSRPHSISGMY